MSTLTSLHLSPGWGVVAYSLTRQQVSHYQSSPDGCDVHGSCHYVWLPLPRERSISLSLGLSREGLSLTHSFIMYDELC